MSNENLSDQVARLQYELDHANSHIEMLQTPSDGLSHGGDFVGYMFTFIILTLVFALGFAAGMRVPL